MSVDRILSAQQHGKRAYQRFFLNWFHMNQDNVREWRRTRTREGAQFKEMNHPKPSAESKSSIQLWRDESRLTHVTARELIVAVITVAEVEGDKIKLKGILALSRKPPGWGRLDCDIHHECERQMKIIEFVLAPELGASKQHD